MTFVSYATITKTSADLSLYMISLANPIGDSMPIESSSGAG